MILKFCRQDLVFIFGDEKVPKKYFKIAVSVPKSSKVCFKKVTLKCQIVFQTMVQKQGGIIIIYIINR